ncbi:MAG: hypothetical protein ACLPYS_16810 [Vulcanimicrobiaceae bacterium]
MNVILPQPAFTIWDELTEFDDPHALLNFFDHGRAASELLAQSDLAARTDAFQLRL